MRCCNTTLDTSRRSASTYERLFPHLSCIGRFSIFMMFYFLHPYLMFVHMRRDFKILLKTCDIITNFVISNESKNFIRLYLIKLLLFLCMLRHIIYYFHIVIGKNNRLCWTLGDPISSSTRYGPRRSNMKLKFPLKLLMLKSPFFLISI